MAITLDEAKKLKRGTVLHYTRDATTCAKWRVNGKVKTWKRDPGRVEVPLKYGLREYGYLTENELDDFHFESDCPWEKFRDAKASGDLTVLPTLIGIDPVLDRKISQVLKKHCAV